MTEFPKRQFKQKTYKKKIDENSVETEFVEGFIDAKLPQKAKFNNGKFITLFQGAMLKIALNADLTKNEHKLLLFLIATAGVDNSVSLDLGILSSELKVAKPNISNALKGLVNRNIIIRKNGYREGGQNLPFELSFNYDQINYDLAYNGKVKNFKKVQYKHPEIELEAENGQKNLFDEINEFEEKLSKEQSKND